MTDTLPAEEIPLVLGVSSCNSSALVEFRAPTVDDDMPCGRCDVGLYSYASALTPLAHELADAPVAARHAPRCKTMDRECVGACHFIEALNRDPKAWEEIKAEFRAPKETRC